MLFVNLVTSKNYFVVCVFLLLDLFSEVYKVFQ